MRRALIGLVLVVAALLPARPASAASTTEVIQGDIIRLVSVADWDAAGSLRPGEAVQWDVAVSAETPEPGTVTIAMSATGGTELLIDAELCIYAWTDEGCPGGATELRDGWSIPRDGGQTAIAQMADTETAHVRLWVTLATGTGATATNVRLHASGVGDPVVVGQDGYLAATGVPMAIPAALAAGAALLLVASIALLVQDRHRVRKRVQP